MCVTVPDPTDRPSTSGWPYPESHIPGVVMENVSIFLKSKLATMTLMNRIKGKQHEHSWYND